MTDRMADVQREGGAQPAAAACAGLGTVCSLAATRDTGWAVLAEFGLLALPPGI